MSRIRNEMNKRSVVAPLKMVALSFVVCLYASEIIQAQVVINEVVASNSQGILDEDGDRPDWIEFYNPTDLTINLSGYGISDDSENLFKFILPDIEIPPNQFYLVYASDKDRKNAAEITPLFWETIIREGDNTNYIIPTSPVSSSWIQNEFNDSSWGKGSFGIGYGDDDDATIVPNGTISVFTRTTFTIENLSVVDSLLFHIDFDDGYVAYLNGIEISRFNLDGSAPVAYDALTTTYVDDPTLVKGQELPGIPINNFGDLLLEGENVLAIQIHNSGSGSSDLSLIPFLSIARSEEPETSRGIAEQITIEEFGVAYPHLNFKLSSGGETVFLSNADSVIIDELTYPRLLADESFGRSSEDNSIFYIFTNPTPLEANTSPGYSERLADPELVQKGGFYTSGSQLELVNSSLGDIIYFTSDGTEPTLNSLKFGTDPRTLDLTSTLKFRAIEPGKLPSNTVTHTYIVDMQHDLPVVSVSTAPDNLWSDEIGIYVEGINGIAGNCTGPRNWNQDWEIPVHVELYETDGSLGFSSGAGAKIFGGCSRTNPAKSLSIFFRGEYGNSELNYKLFEEKDIDTFQAFVLRNSGNDFTSQGHAMFRDGLMKTLIEDADLDYQAFRPAVMYLNGEYWGIHNIREKVNEHFIESNSTAKAENIDLLERAGEVIHGSRDNYQTFLNALGIANMNDPEQYQEIEDMIDIDNYVDYMVAQIYYANTDWPGNNIKFWRDRLTNGKWRWIIYDTDFGFDLSYGGSVWHNTLNFALQSNGPGWPNPPWSTFVFRRMVTSDIFVEKFVNRMSDFMNTTFDKDYVNTVIDSLSGLIESEIPKHVEQWGVSTEEWNNQINVLRNFADLRGEIMEGFLEERFGLSSPSEISINVSDEAHGEVRINRINPEGYPWVGSYYEEIPVQLTAIPKRGYEFIGWSGASSSTENTIEGLSGSLYTANFAPAKGVITDIVINEIMYNGSEEQETGDWIELYNSATYTIDMGGWTLKDDDDSHQFTFSSGTELTPGSFLVVAADLVSFNSQYENIPNLYGELGFNLAGSSDQVRLFDDNDIIVDSLQYDDEAPWDSTADGRGFTLELLDPTSDNSLPQSWKTATKIGGTPGAPNSISVSNQETEDVPSKITLKQNYPNPFNPSTNISFELPKQVRIKLTIFDMLGRKVTVLADEIRSSGVHSVNWNASNQSSGVYFYRLEVGREVFTKKMLLIK